MTDNPGFIYLAAPYSTGLIATSPTLRRVAMLPGWRESRGVALEIEWATAAGIPVGYMEGGV